MTREPIDLRSDTVTKPSPAMRRAMAEAEVGDDVYREDPTVRRLEEVAAATLGFDAALFVPSGIMGNLLALLSQAERGSEVLVEADAHIVNYEAGAGAAFAGVQFRTVPGERGLLDPQRVAAQLRPDMFPLTATRMVCVEQTHNRHGGTYAPLEDLRALADLGVPVHVDGARVFNAIAASGDDPSAYGTFASSLTFCLSKGLGAPVGSVLCASADTIEQARGWRRRLGGAMRQVGVLAAAGLVALEESPPLLARDHEHARILAAAAGLDPELVPTNIVMVADVDAPAVVAALRRRSVLAGAMDPRTLRLVTHRDVSREDAEAAAAALAGALAEREFAGPPDAGRCA